MFSNYLKVAWRNLLKNRGYTLLNIAGLAIGLSCFLLIALYVVDESSYDRFYPHADRIYRINADIRFGGADLHMPFTADGMGELLKKDYPEVEEYTRLYTNDGEKLIRKGPEFITETRVAFADSTFFRVFQQRVLAGDTANALNEPSTVVITASMARKYFGGPDQASGKTLEVKEGDKTHPYKVTAVIADMPENSHFRFDMLFSMRNVDYNWGQLLSHNFYTYLLLRPGTDYRAFERHFTHYIDQYVMPMAKQYMNIGSMQEFEKAGNRLEYSLIPLTRIHLHSDRAFELSPTGNAQYVYIFSAVAVFILLIACINFMNLTTARSANRAREVGIRKVLGTERRSLVLQFLAESTLMVLFSLVLALGIVLLCLPAFNHIAAKQMHLARVFSPSILPWLLLLPFVVGLLAGSYPAFFLSGFRPIEVLKGRLRLGTRSGGL
ncbi:MAG TPA: ABC transporter permease, partial [Chitinophagaceae bacterium]|nr:ABC transporter permease [Chitinophagaceae bacterium]